MILSGIGAVKLSNCGSSHNWMKYSDCMELKGSLKIFRKLKCVVKSPLLQQWYQQFCDNVGILLF